MRSNVRALGGVVLIAIGCGTSGSKSGFGEGSSGTSGAGAGGGSSGASGASGGGPDFGPGSDASTPGTCHVTDPSADNDKDGWSTSQGDCNDCDPNVNPGAIDVLHTPEAGVPTWGDEDCSGKAGDSAKACDTGLALASGDANDAAKAVELCQTATATDRRYGVVSAAYVRADGTAFASPGLQVGLQSSWGTGVHPQGGQSMLALSSGHARAIGQPGACGSISCQINATATAPTGFPQDDPACPPTQKIADDVALELSIRVPTNATGYAFSFKFHSFEFPDWVCDKNGYNDQFVALVSPPPAGAYVPTGSSFGNVSFDGNKHPVSVNVGFFDTCDPATPQRFATHCKSGGGACPATPSPYCPLGLADLAGTGFDTWHGATGPAGATRWLKTQAPAQGGSIIKVRFAIWDAGNGQYDSTVLVDDFTWVATGAVPLGTTPVPGPK